jgi:hypothetical protein
LLSSCYFLKKKLFREVTPAHNGLGSWSLCDPMYLYRTGVDVIISLMQNDITIV